MSYNTAFSSSEKAQFIVHVRDVVEQVRVRYNVHGRAFTKTDFIRIVREEKILVNTQRRIEANPIFAQYEQAIGAYPEILGSYTRKTKTPIIYIRSLATGKPFDLETAFHELGHHFLGHGSGLSADLEYPISKQQQVREAHADLFSSLALQEVDGYAN